MSSATKAVFFNLNSGIQMTKKEEINSVSIIGLGNFGTFAASLIPKDKDKGIEVMGNDVRDLELDPSIKRVSLGEAALADVIVLAIPLEKYETVLKPLSSLIARNSLLVDVCSVKREPGRLIRKYLPEHSNILLTHPLFGPRSAADGLEGHKLAVTFSRGKRAEQVLKECEELGIDVQRMGATKHDRIMANVHALTFFVARSLEKMGIDDDIDLFTPSYQMLLGLSGFSKGNSPELFRTVQQGNPYAKEARRKLMDAFHEVEADLSSPSEISSSLPYRTMPN